MTTFLAALRYEFRMQVRKRSRIVAPTRPAPHAEQVEPGLEDGYIALTGSVQAPVQAG